MSATLRVGRIPFLVCAPYFHDSLAGLPGIHFEDGPPRALNALLISGEIDTAPSSSFEYVRHADRYLLLPGLCTSGRDEVKSVLLFSQLPWESLNGKPVSLSPHSETSNTLFRVLSRFRFGVEPECLEPEMAENVSALGKVAIGDEALRESQTGLWPYRYDLAETWKLWQGTPLPFGLWMVRAKAWESKREAVEKYYVHLHKSLASFFADPAAALASWGQAYPLPLTLDKALEFFPTADYELKPDHERALRAFYGFCHDLGLVDSAKRELELRYASV
jgi:chorismate dehydratase